MINVKELIIYPLSKCNLSCQHCYASKENFELSMEDIKWIQQTFNPKKTILMGGEPLLYQHLDYILDVFPNITISTNSYFIKKQLPSLKQHRDKLHMQLSIEGGREETNFIRGYPDNKDVWNQILNSADILKKNDIDFYFRCSYHKDNLKQIEKEVFKLGEKYDVGVMLLPRIDLPSLNVDETANFFRMVLQYKDCAVAQPHFFQFINKKGRCGAGDERLSIYFDKRITPCNFDVSYTLGKIGISEQDLLRNMNIFVENFKLPPMECNGCPNSEICKGSCYIAKSYIGCPLRYNYNINNIIMKDKLDIVETNKEMTLLAKYVKKLGIC
jgi:radical SAM protein with 4Fe4S-binding SPASM domain